jgi:hypothetical protein
MYPSGAKPLYSAGAFFHLTTLEQVGEERLSDLLIRSLKAYLLSFHFGNCQGTGGMTKLMFTNFPSLIWEIATG